MKPEFRTSKQLVQILETTINGNWTTAAEYVVEYGFFANDLVLGWEELKLQDDDPGNYLNPGDLCVLAEMATNIRRDNEHS
jgi:hypothetical protein